MANLDLSKYGISGNFEIVHNPSYEELFQEEMNPANEGFEKGVLTTTGAVSVDTGKFTGRSPKDKFFVKDAITDEHIGHEVSLPGHFHDKTYFHTGICVCSAISINNIQFCCRRKLFCNQVFAMLENFRSCWAVNGTIPP